MATPEAAGEIARMERVSDTPRPTTAAETAPKLDPTKAYAMLGIIKRNFIYLSEEAFVSLYKTLVRSHLEYANSVWNPYRMGVD